MIMCHQTKTLNTANHLEYSQSILLENNLAHDNASTYEVETWVAKSSVIQKILSAQTFTANLKCCCDLDLEQSTTISS